MCSSQTRSTCNHIEKYATRLNREGICKMPRQRCFNWGENFFFCPFEGHIAMLYFSVPLKGAVAFTSTFILYIDFRNYICVGDIYYWRTILMLSLPNRLQSSVYAEVGTEREWFAIHCDDEESQQGGKRSCWRRCWTGEDTPTPYCGSCNTRRTAAFSAPIAPSFPWPPHQEWRALAVLI